MNHDETHSLGAILSAARQERGLPLEQVAHETRIRVQRLKEIEADDLSQFAHPSYARMFLTDYARYLEVPLDKIRPYLPEWGECGTEGYQYLQETPVNAVKGVRRMAKKPRFRTLIVMGASLILVSMGGFKLLKTVRDIERLNRDRIAQQDKSTLDEVSKQTGIPDGSQAAAARRGGVDPVSDISDAMDIPETVVPELSGTVEMDLHTTDMATLVLPDSAKPSVPDFASEDKAVLFVGGSESRVQ